MDMTGGRPIAKIGAAINAIGAKVQAAWLESAASLTNPRLSRPSSSHV
ncbi:hypothetical protein J2858_000833 [Neorhizobium galegae]|nr:hypothetical protein [Neorhizobium galegae]MBP2547940.1 hypothetical protein [Neorhizobium galegae]